MSSQTANALEETPGSRFCSHSSPWARRHSRSDYIQVLLNSETGEVITTEYHPQDGASKT